MAHETALDPAMASGYASTALVNIAREYPNKPDHVLDGPADLRPPRDLHPVFYGSYDWHSCVHMHWLLVRLLRLVPELAETNEIVAALDERFTPEAVAREIAYLGRPTAATFERPYGWAWLLALDAEVHALAATRRVPGAQEWALALDPLAGAFVDRFRAYLGKAKVPVRAGTHANSAFALDRVLDYASVHGEGMLADLVRATAGAWYATDGDYPVRYEPSAEDFLSPGLMEAALMLRVLPEGERAGWLARFLPDWTSSGIGRWLAPEEVPDRTDARLVHLDGLNLSRAWCWRRLARSLPIEDERRAMAERAAARHLDASLGQAVGSDYVAEHWLATFAVLALTG
jgi:hypothetical protein